MEAKICPKCGNEKPITNFASQGSKKSDRSVVYRDSICRKCRRSTNRSSGLCVCGQPLVAGKASCKICLQAMRDSMTRRHIRDRAATLEYYGRYCNYCGENIERFLTIDHKNNDGAEHRRNQRNGGQGGHEIYAWLRKNNYPNTFQTLCYNCNCSKSYIGELAVLELLEENNRLAETGQMRLKELRMMVSKDD